MLIVIKSLKQLQREAERLVSRLLSKSPQVATVVALSGELGAGKTTFAQGIAETLGVDEHVTSPTFVIEKVYDLPMTGLRNPSFKRLIHIDSYRLEGAHELEVLGWKELLQDPDNLIVLEWPERVADAIPRDAIRVTFDFAGDGRIISIDGEEENGKNNG